MSRIQIPKKRPWQTVILLLTCLLCSHPLLMDAQDSLMWRDFDFVRTSGVWLKSKNCAALTTFSSANISQAEVSFMRSVGGHTDFSDSKDSREASANVSSLYRINSRTVLSGEMSYNNFTGKDMGGSVFINNSRLPFDIEEDSLTNLGKKHSDTYSLSGGVGVDVYRGLSLGAHVDYTAANYAKYKDLRHKNKLMDMTLTAGVFAPIGQVLWLGGHYYYRRTTESVIFGTYGKEEKVYKSFINYGPYIGKVEQFSNSGLTDKTREMPLVDDYNGAGLQIGMRLGEHFTFSNDLTYAHRKGYYGRKSPYTITYSHHESDVYMYQLCADYRDHKMAHQLSASLSVENLTNHFSTYLERINDSGASYYDYFDDIKTANKLWVTGHVGYTASWDIKRELPLWSISLAYDWLHRKQTGYSYPYYRRQILDSREYSLVVTRNLLLRHGVLTLSAQGSFRKGSGDPYTDLTFATPSDKQTPPPTMEAWMYREYLWLTAAQYAVGGSVKYAFVLPGTRLCSFVKASVSHRKANETNEYAVGRDRLRLGISAGCNF